jgi:hypothetical protein
MAKKPTRSRRSRGESGVRPARKRVAPRRKTPETTRAATPDAQFVFRGTVLQRGTATMAEVPVTENTIVVRVDEIVHGSDIVRDFEGEAITVQLGDGQTVTEGQDYIFHTNGWLFGTSIAVVAVAVEPADADSAQQLRAAVSAGPAQAAKARAERADLVVSGQVTQVTQVPRPPGAPISEHEPEWQEAVVQVHHVARGGARGRRPGNVTIRFAASRDVRWARAPKFGVGQEGVWMLGDKTKEGSALRAAAAVPKDQYLVVEPDDFYPKESAARVLSQIE